jgi:hypothetical protein
MAAFIVLAHVGFHGNIGKVADGVLRLHRLYVAELCGSCERISKVTVSVRDVQAACAVSGSAPEPPHTCRRLSHMIGNKVWV